MRTWTSVTRKQYRARSTHCGEGAFLKLRAGSWLAFDGHSSPPSLPAAAHHPPARVLADLMAGRLNTMVQLRGVGHDGILNGSRRPDFPKTSDYPKNVNLDLIWKEADSRSLAGQPVANYRSSKSHTYLSFFNLVGQNGRRCTYLVGAPAARWRPSTLPET